MNARRWILAGIAALGSLAVLAGCSQDVALRPDAGGSIEGVPIEQESTLPTVLDRLESGARSGVRVAQNVVVRDLASWQDLWTRHAAGRTPSTPAPVVDFGSHMVVAVFLGDKPSSGYAAHIVAVNEHDDVLIADIVATIPPPGTAEFAVITQPYDIVTIRSSDRAVEFAFRETTGEAKSR